MSPGTRSLDFTSINKGSMVIFDEGYSYCKCFEPRFPLIPQETYNHIKQELGTWEIGSFGVKSNYS